MEGLDEIAPPIGEHVRCERPLDPKLRVKVEVIIPEPLQPGKALEMEDRAKQLTEPPCLAGLRAERALLQESRDDLALAHWNEVIAPRHATIDPVVNKCSGPEARLLFPLTPHDHLSCAWAGDSSLHRYKADGMRKLPFADTT